MSGKDQVLRLLDQGCDYTTAARRLGIPPGQAYLIATGVPADGGDTVTRAQRDRPGFLGSGSQELVNPRQVNPTARTDVHDWIRWRVHTDPQMRAAGARGE
jgi:hypothetical protein